MNTLLWKQLTTSETNSETNHMTNIPLVLIHGFFLLLIMINEVM